MIETELQSRPKQLLGYADFSQWQRILPSRVDMVSPFVDELMRFIAKFRAKDGSELEIEMAAQEALANAVVHGNQMDLEKRVYVTCGCALDGEVNLTIRDEGQGFKPDCVAGPHAPENHLRISGRGIHLMKTFMDEVLFEQGGSVVSMRKNPQRRLKHRRGLRSTWKSLLWRGSRSHAPVEIHLRGDSSSCWQ